MNQEIKNIFLLTFIFSAFWILVPLTGDDFVFNSLWVKRGVRMLLFTAIIVVFNVKVLLPRFYFKNKYGLFFFWSALLIITVTLCVQYLIDPFFDLVKVRKFHEGNSESVKQAGRFFKRIIPFVLTLIGSTLFEVSRFADEKMKETLVLRSEKTEAEMKLLKSQINPHFLFNALNNIYSLSYLKPEKTPENLLKLSQILRYMLYECNDEFVPLAKEVTSLENFIALNLLKDSRGMRVKVNMEKPSEDLMIAPMLLLPFVENAFKHAKIEDLENGWINIHLETRGKQLIFRTENSIPDTNFTKDSVGGIGLTNVKRRLDLVYLDKNELKITTENNTYTVQLEIDLT